MNAFKQKKAFPNYTEIQPALPRWFWHILRIVTLLLTLFVIYTLFTLPELGLTLFWKLLIPLLPLSFALVPGLWRNICPMAFLNQLPRLTGFGLQLTLPVAIRKYALLISITAFIVFVVSRAPLLNNSSNVLGAILLIALILALAGGFIFKGRSGWCGTFCPLAPIQKAYGHAPVLLIRNGYCEPCLGCQHNCYDFNPRAAIFSDLGDTDPWWSDKRKYFAAMLPGLIAGYFNASQPGEAGNYAYYTSILIPPLIAIGLYHSIRTLFQFSEYKLVALFSLAALFIFYWYGTPVVIEGIEQISGYLLPDIVINFIRTAVLLACLTVAVRGLISERDFHHSMLASNRATIAGGIKSLQTIINQSRNNPMVVERSSDKHFEVRPEQSLLDAMEAADLPIVSGCRMGMCGSDPVFVVDGMNNLQPPDENEITTLKRLGLEGKARMACCCKPVGDIAIDLAASPDDLNTQNNGPEHNRADIDIDLRLKVVIIGNGIAGISTAEHLRELDTDCSISLISREPHHFYNRMGLEQVIYGRTAMQGLYLMQPDWYQRNAIDVWLNTQVELIHRDARQISLATGETLPYDKLIIATGGSAFVPPVTGFDLPGCFTLRNAEDALHLRAWIQQYRCKQATVLGGGVLGVEAASALHQLGLRVSIIQHSHQLMNMQLDLHAAVILKKFLENSGIKILTGTGIEHAEGEERIKKIILSNGNIMATDILVICTGIRANTQLANECGLQINRGIIVDEYMRTSDENIYCVGDAAELPGTITGLWAVGNEQGKIAAAHITGEGNSYKNTAIPPVQLKVPGIDLKSFGTFDENGNAESYTNGDIDKYCWKHILIDDGKITAGVFVNAPQAAGAAIASSRNNSKKLSSEDLEAIMKMN